MVDGMVQVYAQSGHQPEVQSNLWDDEDMNGYQLLNEVGSGGTLSSLFTILSLFTEDVPLSWQDDDHGPSTGTSSAFEDDHHPQSDPDIPPFDLSGNPVLSEVRQRRHSTSSVSTASTARSASGLHVPSVSQSRRASMSPSVFEDAASQFRSMASSEGPGTPRPHGHHTKGVLARATVDTTLAVIPAEAFRRLTKKYPKATGHIVQGKFAELRLLVHANAYL